MRDIINIDEEKCIGCGLCISACHEGAIELVDGKARLIGDEYCDGLGNCLPKCPVDAISIIQREGRAYDEEAVKKRKEEVESQDEDLACGCPGSMSKAISRPQKEQSLPLKKTVAREKQDYNDQSELNQWPVQLSLINTKAPYLQNSDLLLAADCSAYAYRNFHEDFIKGKITMIGCPKLDDTSFYQEKLGEILLNNDIKSLTVVRMEVPCCSGIVAAAKGAMFDTGIIVPYQEVTIGTEGEIIQ